MKRVYENITLNDGEQAVCRTIAKLRFDNNRKHGVANSKIGKQDDEFTDLEGIGGEFAFCKKLNIMPDFSIDIRSSQTDVGDCIYNGKRIDVKTTKYENGSLIVVPWKKNNVDLFVLMVGQFPTYSYRGRISASVILDANNFLDLGYGKVYGLSQDKLDY